MWRALSRRDRTRAEVRGLLERRGIDPDEAEAALAEVASAGYLDDADFARRFSDDRRGLAGWGEVRIRRELERRGVTEDVIAATLAGRSADEELAAACAVLRERARAELSDDRARGRAFGLLTRRGYSSETAYEAIRRHGGGP